MTDPTLAMNGADMILGAEDPLAEIASDLYDLGFHEDHEIAQLAYLGIVARRFGEGLPIIFTGQTSTGKSHISEVLASWVPDEDRIRIQYATPQAILSMAAPDGQPLDLGQKVLVADERPDGHVDPGYLRTLYASGSVEVPKAVGNSVTIRRLVGRPAMLETTTASRIHDEDENRRLILPVDESPEKLRRIIDIQNQRAAGDTDVDPDEIAKTQQEVQRQLPTLDAIRIPFAPLIRPDAVQCGWMLRAHQQLLTITRAVGLVRYRHRLTTPRELWCKLDDYDVAHHLLAPLHGRSLSQLSQQEIGIVEAITKGLSNRARRPGRTRTFTRTDIQTWSGVPRRTMERRLTTIVASGIVRVVTEGGRGRHNAYELAEDWRNQLIRGSPFPTAAEVRAAS